MLRLAEIPNSRCLAKIKTNGEKKQNSPDPKSQVQWNHSCSHWLQAVLLPTRWPHRGGREWDTTGWMLLPKREAQIWSLRQAGRGENTS